MRFIYLALALMAILAARAYGATPVVTIDTGKVAGESGSGINVYKGIPYAAPPTGNLRWAPPAPAGRRGETLDATEFGPACPQPARPDRGRDFGPQSEDCLTLNVWAPENAANAPVMVWIHGGAFRIGNGGAPFYDGRHFADKGIVFVSINYRLGYLGFFAHPALTAQAGDAPLANYGLMDQVAALKWVQHNIAAFGGDPAQVTIFGESAGASSVLFLMASPEARGLFARAISESGGGFQRPRYVSHDLPNM
ncbi:MAG: carboxylesterase family protein, partial [Pseudomonadales bacterium]|nr:carboxylesterase family protein [Pseudomonadales bacterium]